MMHIGLNGYPRPEDWALIEDLGVTWIKISYDLFQEPHILLQQAEACRDHGLQVVVDLRMDDSDVTPMSWQQVYRRRYAAQRALDEADPQAAERIANQGGETVLQRCVRLAHEEAMGVFGEEVADLVQAGGHLVGDWEIQGEFMCPTVITGSLRNCDYLFKLVRLGQAIHGVDPSARVWTGGNGVWVNSTWIRQLMEPHPEEDGVWQPEGAAGTFEVVNWHHYGHSVNGSEAKDITLEEQLAAYDQAFGEARAALDEHGKGQPFASTEWGFPMSNQPGLTRLASMVYAGGVRTLREDAAPEWYEACLENMDKWGFRVVCIHELRERQEALQLAYFWGGFCGLYDAQGRRRPVADTVQKWAWRARESGEEAFQS